MEPSFNCPPSPNHPVYSLASTFPSARAIPSCNLILTCTAHNSRFINRPTSITFRDITVHICKHGGPANKVGDSTRTWSLLNIYSGKWIFYPGVPWSFLRKPRSPQYSCYMTTYEPPSQQSPEIQGPHPLAARYIFHINMVHSHTNQIARCLQLTGKYTFMRCVCIPLLNLP